jgi:hypothetical protein
MFVMSSEVTIATEAAAARLTESSVWARVESPSTSGTFIRRTWVA